MSDNQPGNAVPAPVAESPRLTTGEGLAIAGISFAAIAFQTVLFVFTYLILRHQSFDSSQDANVHIGFWASVSIIFAFFLYFSPLFLGWSLVKKILDHGGYLQADHKRSSPESRRAEDGHARY